ncbi:MAG: SRPBCC domain-containing protein [Acidimicrobiia bacterium]|nr:SRPBCC domain-containing protein [Acidimicrobiia bacterium]
MRNALHAEVTGDGEITLTAHLVGSPEVAWDYLTSSEHLPKWLGHPVIFDLEVGGGIEVEVDSGDRFAGTFVAIDRPRSLVFTWGWRSGPVDIAPGATRVEMTLEPSGEGSELQLVHRDLGEWAERNIVGWSLKFSRLIDLFPIADVDPR